MKAYKKENEDIPYVTYNNGMFHLPFKFFRKFIDEGFRVKISYDENLRALYIQQETDSNKYFLLSVTNYGNVSVLGALKVFGIRLERGLYPAILKKDENGLDGIGIDISGKVNLVKGFSDEGKRI